MERDERRKGRRDDEEREERENRRTSCNPFQCLYQSVDQDKQTRPFVHFAESNQQPGVQKKVSASLPQPCCTQKEQTERQKKRKQISFKLELRRISTLTPQCPDPEACDPTKNGRQCPFRASPGSLESRIDAAASGCEICFNN